MNFGVVMDPIEAIRFESDTSLSLLLEAQKRGWKLHYFETKDLYVRDGVAMGRGKILRVADDPRAWFSFESTVTVELGSIDLIVMRKDPPFDAEYVFATYILETAERQGAFVVNSPRALRDANEKFFATRFAACMAPTLVTKDASLIAAFVEEHGDCVLKPMDWMGGTGIFTLRRDDANVPMLLETFVEKPRKTMMIQKFIPEIATRGDKRIFIVNGKTIEKIFTRIPKVPGQPANAVRGGKPMEAAFSARDRWICDQISPTLREMGLLFSAIDVIGDYLTEINVTSPMGIRFHDKLFGMDLAKIIFDEIITEMSKK